MDFFALHPNKEMNDFGGRNLIASRIVQATLTRTSLDVEFLYENFRPENVFVNRRLLLVHWFYPRNRNPLTRTKYNPARWVGLPWIKPSEVQIAHKFGATGEEKVTLRLLFPELGFCRWVIMNLKVLYLKRIARKDALSSTD